MAAYTSERDWERIRHNYEQWEIDGIEQVIDQSGKYYLSTRAELIKLFRNLHPGDRTLRNGKLQPKWHRPLAEAIQPFTINKKGEPQKVDYIMRRFQTGREHSKVSKAQQAQYEALGKTFGWQHLIPPEGGYYVAFEGFIRFSECEPKDFEVDLTDKEAEELAAHPEDLVDIVLKKWLQEEDMESPSSAVCTISQDKGTETDPAGQVTDPTIIVLAIGDQVHEPVTHKTYYGKILSQRKRRAEEEESYL